MLFLFILIVYIWGCALTGASISVPKTVAKRIREEAEKLGMTSEEYLLELVTRGLDPRDRAREYIGVAEELLEQAREELGKGGVRQAAEKLWGAAALAVKAYASWREGRRVASHGELWEYKRRMVKELGGWVSDAWYAGQAMHTCFHEGWCAREDIEDAYRRVEKLVKEVASRIEGERREPT